MGTISEDAMEVCLAYHRWVTGSDNALCGIAKLAKSVAERVEAENALATIDKIYKPGLTYQDPVCKRTS